MANLKETFWISKGPILLPLLATLILVAFTPRITHAQQYGVDACPSGTKMTYATPFGADHPEAVCEDSTGKITQNATPVAPVAGACDSITNFFGNFRACVGRSVSVLLGTALISLTAWLLALVGLLFNVLVDQTIISFGALYGYIQPGLEIGWTAFRDVANIIIIGMFVFIAISIILGLKEFGEKKLIARVLIVAVLINFSLLFTKVIIDGSNFTALQFYNASKISQSATATSGVNPLDGGKFSQSGISGQFLNFMGVTSIGDTVKALSAAAYGDKSNQYVTANGWNALLFGLFSATLLLTAALVLLYGCFLIVTRAVLIILLMLTSAPAFASWLIPHQLISRGWTRWWETLIRSAIFAPMLMIFLWITLLVAQYAKTGLQNAKLVGTLGDLITKPQNPLNLEALFIYVLIIGLLFASFKAASMFSHTIAGFAAVSQGVGFAALTPLAGASRIGGLFGRTVVGGLSNAAARGMANAGWGEAGTGLRGVLGRAAMRPFDWASRQRYDALGNQTVRKTIESFGGAVFGDKDLGKGGFRALKERQAEEIDRLSKRLAPSKSARETLANAAGEKAGAQARAAEQKKVEGERTQLAREKEATDKAKEVSEANIKREREAAQAEHDGNSTLQTTKNNKQIAEQMRKEAAQNRDALTKELAEKTGEADKAPIRENIKKHDENIAAQDVRIREANAIIEPLEAGLSQKLKDIEAKAEPERTKAAETAKKLEEFEANAPKRLDKAYNDAHKTEYDKRDERLQAKTIAETMAKGKIFTVGNKEILRQLKGNVAEKDALRKFAIATGESGGKKEEKTPEAPKAAPAVAPAAPSTGGHAAT